MGILNITTDSFFSESRATEEHEIEQRVRTMIDEGADFIDIGACSTRPGFYEISIEDELGRIQLATSIVRKISADIPISIDTFRAKVAEIAINDFGANIINDISGANFDPNMLTTIARINVPYVLTHSRGNITTMHSITQYDDLVADVVSDLAKKSIELQLSGVNDIILDPGLGFSKNLDQNYQLLRHLEALQCLHLPILVGASRKSMITKLLDISSDQALNATTAINMIALINGAAILRVHDVKAAKETIKIYLKTYINP